MNAGKAQSEREASRRIILIFTFALYLLLLIYCTLLSAGFGRIATNGATSMTLAEYFKARGNLVPLRTIANQTKALLRGFYPARHYVTNVIGNLAAFAPCAYFLPRLFPRCRKFPVFFAVTSLMVIAVETLQLFMRVGSFDVDDYILNMLGASLFFLLLKFIQTTDNNKIETENDNEKDNSL